MDRASKPFLYRHRLAFLAGIFAAAILFCTPSGVSAQGGQTEVPKTSPGTPPSPPAAPAQAPMQQQPEPAPVSPVGSGAGWQTNAAASPPIPGVAASDLQIVQQINAYFNTMTDLQGTFVQTDPSNKQTKGKFYFERPGKVLFDYASPSKLKIISDGKYLAIEDHDLERSDRYDLEITPFRLLLTPNVDLSRDANILAVEQSPTAVVLTVEDKKGNSGGKIRLFFSKPLFALKEWIVTDPQGLDTRIEVSNLETNKQVSASLFEFSKDIGFKGINQ